MTDYPQANRPDLAILDVLSKCIDPITLTDIQKRVGADTDWVSLGALGTATEQLVSDGLATRSCERAGIMSVYGITCKGRARLIVADTNSIFHNHLKDEPISVSMCNAPEVPEDPEPAVALLCVHEDELDDWWNALDVEAKGDAFAQWSLGNDGRNSHVYIEPRPPQASVPVVGTAGETAEEWNDKAARLNEKPKPADPSTAPSTAPMSCSYCGGHSYPFQVHLGEGDKVEGSACLNPNCLAQLAAQFPNKVRGAQ